MSHSFSPRANAFEAAHCATWTPHDIAYSEDFDNALQRLLDHPPQGRDGIAVLSNDSSDHPQPAVSVRARDIDPNSLPALALHHLPLPLDDPRRIYASPLPGIRLTHPAGYFEGGPGPSPDEQRAFARHFIAAANITDPDQLSLALHHHIAQNMALAKERMHARHDALQHNARIEKEIKTLMDQREMEVKIETRMKEDAHRRRESRDTRKVPTV